MSFLLPYVVTKTSNCNYRFSLTWNIPVITFTKKLSRNLITIIITIKSALNCITAKTTKEHAQCLNRQGKESFSGNSKKNRGS